MKKIVGLILLAVMVLIAVPAKSQIKFGIKGGLNISSVHFNKDLVGKDNVTGFNIGPMVEVMAPIMGVGFDAAILYSQKGISDKSRGKSIVVGCGMTTSPKPISTDIL